MEIVVPGRLCLTGEHSDWAAGYRSNDPTIEMGMAVVICTNEDMAIHASVRKTAEKTFTIIHNELDKTLSVQMESTELLKVARTERFWAYAVGVAYVILSRYSIPSGIYIEIKKASLPMSKGLSSSAAVCVLVARAFNQLFHLSLHTQGEMEIAYSGERVGGSLCGSYWSTFA
jgi:galactokinase